MTTDPSEPFWRKQAAALDAFLEQARRQGYVTLSDLAEITPTNSEPHDIEDMLSILDQRGIHVVEDDG